MAQIKMFIDVNVYKYPEAKVKICPPFLPHFHPLVLSSDLPGMMLCVAS